MAEYTKTGNLVLFKNANKKSGTNQPDYNGTLTINDVDHRISGWVKTDKNGNSFISGATSVENASEEEDTSEGVEQTELF